MYLLNHLFNHEVDPMLSRTSNGKLFSINEEEQREALKGFYERWEASRAPDSRANCLGPELGIKDWDQIVKSIKLQQSRGAYHQN